MFQYYVHTQDINSHVELIGEGASIVVIALRSIPEGLDDKDSANQFERAMNLLQRLKKPEDQAQIGAHLVTLAPIQCRCSKCEEVQCTK